MRFLRAIFLLATSHLGAAPGRSLSVVASVAVALASGVFLLALVSPELPDDAADANILVQNARSGAMLPIHYADTIESMPDVAHVVYIGMLGPFCKPGVPASINAYGGPGVEWLLTDEYGVPRQDFAAWSDHMTGVLVGSRLARQCGWTRGMRVQVGNAMGAAPMEIRIAGIIPDREGDPYLSNIAIGHYEYANRLAGPAQRDRTGGIVAYPVAAGRTAALAAGIDARFATSDPPTYSRVSGEAQSALRKFGQVQVILLWVVLALLACTLLVVVSVMAYAAVQRRAVFGLLLTLGFSRRHAAGAFALQYFSLLIVGAVLGVLAAWGLIVTLAPRIGMLVGEVSLPSTTVLLAGGTVLGMLACGLALPLLLLRKAQPTDANGF